jgi:RimJ/RimL family protein N-acetyltransferase
VALSPRTSRLLLRPWRDEDIAAFAEMSATNPEWRATVGGPSPALATKRPTLTVPIVFSTGDPSAANSPEK